MALPTKLENDPDNGKSTSTQLSLRHIGQEHGFLSNYDIYALFCGDELVECTDPAACFVRIPRAVRQEIFLSSEIEETRLVSPTCHPPRYNCLLKVFSVITDKTEVIEIHELCD